MPTIGGILCDIIDTDVPQVVKERVETYAVPGLDGLFVQALGKSRGEGAMLCVRYANPADLLAWAASIEALLTGDAVTVVDSYGDTYEKVQVVNVSRMARREARENVGSQRQRGEIRIDVHRLP